MIGHFAAGGGASGGFGLSHEHDGKVIRQRHVSKARRSANAGARGDLSPLSFVRGCDKPALGVNGGGWLFERDDELPFGFDAGCPFVLPITGEPARGSTSDADNHGRPAGSHTSCPPGFDEGLVAEQRPRIAALQQPAHTLAGPDPFHGSM